MGCVLHLNQPTSVGDLALPTCPAMSKYLHAVSYLARSRYVHVLFLPMH